MLIPNRYLTVLTTSIFLHLVAFGVLKHQELGVQIFLPTWVASEQVPRIIVEVNLHQLEIAFEQSLYVISSDTEDGVINQTFWKRPISDVGIFGSQSLTLTFNFFFDEFAFKPVHGLNNLLLGRSWSHEPRMFLDLLQCGPIQKVV